MNNPTATIDKITVTLDGERSLLELVRKAGIELPTFCYHTEISVYGACRMCMVEVEGLGVVPACTTSIKPGMVVHTNTKQIRAMRKMIVELMLANHDQSCTTCPKSGECRLQSISQQLGVKEVRFKKIENEDATDLSSEAIVRDPGKCVLCGDCVRVCKEIQGVGALDFAYRGADSKVITSFNRDLSAVECVDCGQCVKVCPVGALTIKTNISDVWDAIHDKDKIVVVQIAPAVRVGLGEYFGEKPGTQNIGKIISALRLLGFDRVYDTCYGADFTVVEEGKEFLQRYEKGENLPQFTSCCPSWVKYAEQFCPDLLGNLSSAKSPFQMFGAMCKDQLPKEMNIPREQLIVVAVMPCTAKKAEAARDEFKVEGNPDVDYVITTDELARMMREHGLDFSKLEIGSFDMPFGFATGAAVIFAQSGGVCEAVLRFAADTLDKGSSREFKEVRGGQGIKAREITVGGKTFKMGIVSGLANAKTLIDKIRSGEEHFDLVEVMACPGGCINGAGQHIHFAHDVNQERAQGLIDNDRMRSFHISSENPFLQKMYAESMDEKKAHDLLHTTYQNRPRMTQDDFLLYETDGDTKLNLSICFGASCYQRGAQDLFTQIMNHLRAKGVENNTEFTANFCRKSCNKGPVLKVNGTTIEGCDFDKAKAAIDAAL